MSCLYIDRKGLELELEAGTLTLRENGQLSGRVPLHMLEQVVINAEVRLSSSLLAQLAHRGVITVLLASRSEAAAFVTGQNGRTGRRRLAQYRSACDEPTKRRWASRTVEAKVRSEMRLLEFAAEERLSARAPARAALGTLGQILEQLRSGSGLTMDQIRGLEGAAAAAYFQCLTELFPSSLGFQERNRRPPRDPVNAALSLGYTVLFGRAMRAVQEHSLDPYIGFLHDPAHGRPSLACDLMEPLRTRIDRLVWDLFRQRVLRKEDFTSDQGRCLMGKLARREFYDRLEPVMESAGRTLRRAVRTLVRSIEDEGGEAGMEDGEE
ncbi:MAG: CRISPR-associated endonuclease Cas1 [Bryobacteraceae bacterium]|nr:CRISPR-associated endonuclease Cas1 [Bryobacteraceae bacterium]